MEQWNFQVDVYVSDSSLDWIHEIAEIECRLSVECELDFGQEESYWDGPARPRRANLIEAKIDEIRFLPHEPDESLELKFELLLDDTLRNYIGELAIQKLHDEWRSHYSSKAFQSCEEYYRYED